MTICQSFVGQIGLIDKEEGAPNDDGQEMKSRTKGGHGSKQHYGLQNGFAWVG